MSDEKLPGEDPGGDLNEELAAIAESFRRRKVGRRMTNWATALLALLGGIAGLVAAMTTTFIIGDPYRGTDFVRAQFYSDIESLEARLSILEERTTQIGEQITALGQVDPSTDFGNQLAMVQGDIKEVTGRLEILERGILESPEKALSLPLLRKDLESLTDKHRSDYQNAIKSVDRVYDQNKWFLALMATMALGLIGLAVNNFIQSGKKDEIPPGT